MSVSVSGCGEDRLVPQTETNQKKKKKEKKTLTCLNGSLCDAVRLFRDIGVRRPVVT